MHFGVMAGLIECTIENLPWLISTIFPDSNCLRSLSYSLKKPKVGSLARDVYLSLASIPLDELNPRLCVIDSLDPAPSILGNRSNQAWNALYRLAFYTGGRPENWKPSVSSIFQWRYRYYDRLGFSTKWLKYHLSSLVALILKQELPPRPVWVLGSEKPGLFLTGGGYLWLKARLNRSTLSHCVTFNHAKGSFPDPSEVELHMSFFDLRKTLSRGEGFREQLKKSTDQLVDLSWSESLGLPEKEDQVYDLLVREVKRTASELFKTSDPYLKLQSPSLSAANGFSRGEGGQASRVCELLQSFWSERFDCSDHVQESISDMSCEPEEIISFLSRFMESNEVVPTALPEPLKVRMITTGKPVRYYLLSLWQSYFWKVIGDNPVFALTKQSIDDDENFVKSRFEAFPEVHKLFVSADYSAATDNLDPQFSIAIVDALFETHSIDPFWRQVLVDGLTGATVNCRRAGTYQQSWGQLMGSPISFPFLCIVNAAIFRLAIEQAERNCGNYNYRIRLKRCPLLVNGDDAVCQMTPLAYRYWKYFVPKTGLIPSIGKNFVSTDFFVINSEFFRRNFLLGASSVARLFCNNEDFWDRVPYVNLGLINIKDACRRGQFDRVRRWLDRSGYERSVLPDDLAFFGDVAWELVNRAPVGLKEKVLSDFIHCNLVKGGLLDSIRAPLYISRQLGGLGLPLVDPSRLSETDLRFGLTSFLYLTHISAVGLILDSRVRIGQKSCLTFKRPTCWDTDFFVNRGSDLHKVMKSRSALQDEALVSFSLENGLEEKRETRSDFSIWSEYVDYVKTHLVGSDALRRKHPTKFNCGWVNNTSRSHVSFKEYGVVTRLKRLKTTCCFGLVAPLIVQLD